MVDKRRIGRGIQADLLVDPTRATALIRPVAGMPNKGHMSQSTDGGLTWSEPTPTDWTNPGSPLCAARFEDGREIVAYNDDDTLRSNFAFASRSGGSDEWGRLNFRIESSSGNDWISYCDMDIGTDQTVTMVYSRVADRSIRGVRFNRAWVEAQQAGGAE